MRSLSLDVPSPSEALHPFSTVIVTGGSSGIGKSFIELCGKLKPELVICNLARRSLPENIFPNFERPSINNFSCDLSRPAEVAAVSERLAEFIRERAPAGGVLLINNAGFGAFGRFEALPLERELQMIDLNVRAVVELTGRLLPLLRARGGAILNVASTMSFQPTPYAATYGATKAFVLHWTLALNEELRGTNVRALAVCPGTTKTAFFRTAGLGEAAISPRLAMTTDEVVTAALRALGARRAQVVTGWKNRLYTFAGSKLPKPLVARIAARILGEFRLGQKR